MIHRIKEPLLNFKLKDILRMSDIYTLCMVSLYSIFAIVFYWLIPNAGSLLLTNFFIGLTVITIATIDEKYDAGSLFRLFRKTYVVAVVFMLYAQVQPYLKILNPGLFDYELIKMDLFLFGEHPSKLLQPIVNPYLTEYLQFTYMTFFFMPLAHGVELHLSGKDKELGLFKRMILFQFYVSYLLYFFVPAIGPRFEIWNFSQLSSDLPGVWLTEFFRSIVNLGGNIPMNHPNPALMVNKDCMPSGHTMITIANIIMVFRNKSKFRYLILLFGSSLIFATIYLRYHYVVDVIAGAICGIICLMLEEKVRSFFKDRLGFINA